MHDGAVSRRGVLGVLAAVGGGWVGGATGTRTTGTRNRDRTATTQTDAIPCPAYQYDVGHRGYAPGTTGPDSSPVERRWRLEVDDLFLPGQAVLGNGLLYAIATGTLYAIDVSAGEVRWDYPIGDLDNAEPYAATLDGDTVYAPGDGTLYALDASTGAERWTAEGAFSAPTVAGGTVYTTDGAFDADDGSQVWTTDLDVDDAVAVADDAVYVTDRLDGELYELDRTTGRENWRVRVGGDPNSTPALVGDRVVFANQNGNVYVVDRADEAVVDRLTYETGGYCRYAPAVDEDTAYVLVHGAGAVHAVDLELGEARWTTGVEGDELYNRAPVVAGDTVYLGGHGEVLALDTDDGSVRWRHDLDSALDKAWTVTVHDGTCYAPVQEGYLLAIEAFNREPSAAAAYSPREPAPGTEVTFDGADSSDPDGELASYEWDLDDDGSFEASGREVTHTFDEPGEHPVTLRVTDGDGATDTTTVTVTVRGTPTPTETATPADTTTETPTPPERSTPSGTVESTTPTVQPPETTTAPATNTSPTGSPPTAAGTASPTGTPDSGTPTRSPTATEGGTPTPSPTATEAITPTGDLGGGATDADGPGFGALAALGGGGLSVLLRRAWRQARDGEEAAPDGTE